MIRNILLHLNKEEKLSEPVKKYSSLSNRSCKICASNTCMGNFWMAVEKKMGFEKFKINTADSAIERYFLKAAL